MKFALVFLVPLALVLAGCTLPTPGQQNLKDCGTDVNCFNDAAENCTPAKVTISQTSGGASMTMYSELRGYNEQHACRLYMKFLDISVPSTSALQSEMVKAMVKDKDMECAFPKGASYSASSGFGSYQTMTQYCKGSLMDAMSMFYGVGQSQSAGYGSSGSYGSSGGYGSGGYQY